MSGCSVQIVYRGDTWCALASKGTGPRSCSRVAAKINSKSKKSILLSYFSSYTHFSFLSVSLYSCNRLQDICEEPVQSILTENQIKLQSFFFQTFPNKQVFISKALECDLTSGKILLNCLFLYHHPGFDLALQSLHSTSVFDGIKVFCNCMQIQFVQYMLYFHFCCLSHKVQ